MAKKKTEPNIFDLFKIVELTRTQPQYGHGIGGVKKWQLSNLAEHHYLVTFIAWQISEAVKAAGGKIDQLKVLELCMVHDLGEIFGGDIGMPYARRNPKAKDLARKFEEENAKFISQYFENPEKFNSLWREATAPKSDEAQIAKVADLLEIFCFRYYNNVLTNVDDVLAKERFAKAVAAIKDKKTKSVIEKITRKYFKDFRKGNALSIISGIKS
jgi:5'-deoxynucleotidase YfbR-like HD superfamily hydrolase